MKDIQAVLLAGGIGKRMWPLSQNKSLLKFLGRPIIETVINDLISAGIKDIKIVANKNNNQPISRLVSQKKAKIVLKNQNQPLGMANALETIRPLLTNKPLLIVIATDLYQQDAYSNFLAQVGSNKIVLGGVKIKNYLPGGYFKLKGKKIIGRKKKI